MSEILKIDRALCDDIARAADVASDVITAAIAAADADTVGLGFTARVSRTAILREDLATTTRARNVAKGVAYALEHAGQENAEFALDQIEAIGTFVIVCEKHSVDLSVPVDPAREIPGIN